MSPRRAALSSLRGTLCGCPATVTLTSSVRAAFHCERRLWVFARDIRRLGVAMIGPYSSIGGSGRVRHAAWLIGRAATFDLNDSR